TAMITRHMACEVCSIYLYYEDSREIVLKATTGLNPSSVGQVKMRLGEGLTGQALKERRPICEGRAKDNPHFRYFPGIGEEKFESFLAVPILHGTVEIGVMVIQSEKKNYFTPEDMQIFRAVTSQLAATIETARFLITLNDKERQKRAPVVFADLKFVKGRSGAEGVALGDAVVVDEVLTDLQRFIRTPNAYTEDDFHKAVQETEAQLEDLQEQVETTLFDVAALIFTAQILMLKDKGFSDAIVLKIRQGTDPPQAVVSVVQEYVRKFASITDSYLREKIYDVKDMGRRVLENMTGLKDPHADFEGRIVIARELFPSDVLKLFSQKVKGIILLNGGVTSHVAILSRSLNVPLVIADEPGLLAVPGGTRVLLDAVMGYIHINPDKDTVRKVLDREDLNKDLDRLKRLIRKHPKTRDGVAVKLMANINLLGDLKAANEFKADGIGLYRTEFPFLIRSNFPSEEEQYWIYRRLVEGMPAGPGKEVTFRTLDIGGDKILLHYDYGREENPFLGLRSIRFSLKHKDVFIAQVRAILRAGHGHNVRVLFPMISSVEEFLEAKGIARECAHDLAKEGKEHIKNPPMGAMIELPSVIEIIDELAQESDFLSIGTNDLIQYLLAVDRTNEKVADLYIPHHPSVLRALKKITDAGRTHGKDVCICGDMAHSVKFLPFLLGIGLRHFSMDARYLPKVHEKLSTIVLSEAQARASEILKQSKAVRTAQLLDDF
ncbi:MAG: phosphoenolpyruvate--protein phosphotransferase, partial [Candidatus Omnitrophica bacterium]|nr:phosphoenolpyruvate--protein phosphotransferase [Candidatus Omnitrophota bacterium]